MVVVVVVVAIWVVVVALSYCCPCLTGSSSPMHWVWPVRRFPLLKELNGMYVITVSVGLANLSLQSGLA